MRDENFPIFSLPYFKILSILFVQYLSNVNFLLYYFLYVFILLGLKILEWEKILWLVIIVSVNLYFGDILAQIDIYFRLSYVFNTPTIF